MQKQMTLDVSCTDFDFDKVKATLASQYNVDPSLVSLDNPCALRRRSLAAPTSERPRLRVVAPLVAPLAAPWVASRVGGASSAVAPREMGAPPLHASAARALAALTLTLTIATQGMAADGTAIYAPAIADLLAAVQSVSDAALASTLGTALSTTVVVSSTPPAQVTVSRVLPSICPRGFWCTAGLTVACEVGFFNPTYNANNQSACVKCPEHAITLGTNATSLAQCLCEADYYNDVDATTSGVQCLPCPIGSSCGQPGTTKAALPLKSGFFRMSNATVDVRACSDAAVGCEAGRSECAESHSGCIGGSDPSTPCRAELGGIFCRLCANTSIPKYYVAASEAAPATCSPCEEFMPVLALMMVALLGALVLLMALRRLWRRLDQKTRNWITSRWAAFGLETKAKLVVSFYQIACKVRLVRRPGHPCMGPTSHADPQLFLTGLSGR